MAEHGGPLAPGSVERLRAALAAEPRAVFGYLFGSQATGETTPRSDVDVALWLREPLGEDDHLDMIALATSALHRDDVDVVLLNRAKLTLLPSVLEGQLLVCKDEAFRVHTEALLMSKFHDRWYYVQRHLAQFSRDVLERGLA